MFMGISRFMGCCSEAVCITLLVGFVADRRSLSIEIYTTKIIQ